MLNGTDYNFSNLTMLCILVLPRLNRLKLLRRLSFLEAIVILSKSLTLARPIAHFTRLGSEEFYTNRIQTRSISLLITDNNYVTKNDSYSNLFLLQK